MGNWLEQNTWPHGSNGRYRSGCRCGACRAAGTAGQREVRARKAGLPAGDSRHGKQNGYDHYGCRCGACKAAKDLGRRGKR